MIDNSLKIYIDRLRDGDTFNFSETVSSDFIGVHEPDLNFSDPVHISGQAYLANEALILILSADTVAEIPCSVCNKKFKLKISTRNVATTIELSELKEPIFDYSSEVREALLLEAPVFAECKGCPERETMNQFLKEGVKKESDIQNFPFADL